MSSDATMLMQDSLSHIVTDQPQQFVLLSTQDSSFIPEVIVEPPSIYDIGNVINPSNYFDEICQMVKNLTIERMLHGCYHRFNQNWVIIHPWLRYSPTLNGVYCGPCAILLPDPKRPDKGVLVNKPFSNFNQI